MQVLNTVAGPIRWVSLDVASAAITREGIRLWTVAGEKLKCANEIVAHQLYRSGYISDVKVFALNSAGDVVGLAHNPEFGGTGWLRDTEQVSATVRGSGAQLRDGRFPIATSRGIFPVAQSSVVERVQPIAQPGTRVDIWIRPETNEIVGIVFI